MLRKLPQLIALALFGANIAFAQVTGTVTEAGTDFPLPGVNIVVDGTLTGTTSALDGSYSIEASSGDVLVFSFVGYLSQSIPVGDATVIDVQLQLDEILLEEIVVVGYGTQSREDVTGSVATIDVTNARKGLVTAPDQLIRGRVAGVNVTQNNGEPGAGFNIRIRGGTSISASNEPLYVIDGVPIDNSPITPGGVGVGGAAPPGRNPLNMLNPGDIENITILKDASATAIYGSRGANGVVLITTKSGSSERLSVNYEGYVSASQASRSLELLSGSEYRSFVQQQVSSGILGQSNLDALGNSDTNWEDEVTQTGVSHSHNLSFAGGSNSTNYRASFNYLNQEGAVISSGLERLTARLNADTGVLDDRIRLGINLTSSFNQDDFVQYSETGGFEGALFTNVFAYNPTFPVTNTDGSWYETGAGRQSVRNPVALANQVEDFSKMTRSLGNVSADIDLIEGLTLRMNYGADRSQSTRRTFLPKNSPVGAEFGGRAIQANRERTSQTFQSYLTYNEIFAEDHTVDILAGYEYNEFLFEEFRAETRDFVTDALSYNSLEAGAELIPPTSQKETSRLISFFGRVNYNYRQRYYLTGVLRRDGSSRFGDGNKWAMFPAVSGAWRISEESFLAGNDLFDDLRLKAGWGVVGSQEIANYLSLAQLGADPGNRAVLGGVPITGVAPINFANPDLQWEETSSINVGLDYSLLSGKFSGSIEYYVKNTDNLLLEIPVPQPAPVPTRIENVGETQNQGIEFSLDYAAIQDTDLNVTFGGVFNANSNEVVSLGARDQIITGAISGRGQSDAFAQLILPGEPLGTFYGPIFTGVVDGAQQFQDIDGDGQIEPTGDDRAILGNAQPDFTYGFRANVDWKSWDFSLFIRGVQGVDIFNNTRLVYETKSAVTQGQNFLAAALDDPDGTTEAAKFSSRWIEDGSFIRLDNVTIGYTIDTAQVLSQLTSARIYFSANNLLTITGYEGYDPEVNTNAGLATIGIDYTNYPRSRTFTLGVALGF
jgi:iron complex outermembrane receptor protein